MTINVSNLILKLQQKISGSSDEADLLYYAKAIEQLKTGKIFSIDSVTQLPSSPQNPGALYYVQRDETVYFSSDFGWVEIYKRPVSAIFSWGDNGSSTAQCAQLGDGTFTSQCSPVREISSSIDWCEVSAGNFHSAAIKTSGQLWAWGSNSGGPLGDGTQTIRCSPVRERCSATNWCDVSAGSYQTAAINTSGQLWAWGNNACGRLGDGTTINRCSPVREFCSATDWCSVSTGTQHTSAVKTTGQLWVWGNNAYGRLGDGTTVLKCSAVRERCSATDWCQVSAGDQHTAAVKTSGQIWAWGCNDGGQLGDNTSGINRCSPVREISSSTDWCSLSTGTSRTFAIKTSGQLWVWGSNINGSLGIGTGSGNVLSPVREFYSATDWCGVKGGCSHGIGIKTSGQIWTWGLNTCGVLGDGTTINRCSPVREISSSTNWCQVSAGQRFNTAINVRNL